MKKRLIILSIIAITGLLGAGIVWACCGMGTVGIQITDITATPNPVPCEGDAWGAVQITYTIMLQGASWPDPGWENGAAYADVIVGGTTIVSGAYVSGMDGTYTNSATWVPSGPGTYLVQIKSYSQNGVVTVLEAGPEIVVESCCIEGVAVRITPETFNVQRAGNNVMGHVDGDAVGGTIVSIGGIPCSITGTADPGGPIKFSSAEFSAVAAQIVGSGDARAENVEVVVVAEFADGSVSCGDTADLIDIINEGKKGGKK